MNDKELQFRTAAFGGFQKQDVLNYLEASTRETTVTPVSAMLPFRTAASTPMGMPISAESSTARIASLQVMGNFGSSTLLTGSCAL